MKSSLRSKIEAANEKTVAVMLEAWDTVEWTSNAVARDVIPGMTPETCAQLILEDSQAEIEKQKVQ